MDLGELMASLGVKTTGLKEGEARLAEFGRVASRLLGNVQARADATTAAIGGQSKQLALFASNVTRTTQQTVMNLRSLQVAAGVVYKKMGTSAASGAQQATTQLNLFKNVLQKTVKDTSPYVKQWENIAASSTTQLANMVTAQSDKVFSEAVRSASKVTRSYETVGAATKNLTKDLGVFGQGVGSSVIKPTIEMASASSKLVKPLNDIAVVSSKLAKPLNDAGMFAAGAGSNIIKMTDGMKAARVEMQQTAIQTEKIDTSTLKLSKTFTWAGKVYDRNGYLLKAMGDASDKTKAQVKALGETATRSVTRGHQAFKEWVTGVAAGMILYRSLMFIMQSVTGSIRGTIKAYVDFEDQFANVRKTFEASNEELEGYKINFRELAKVVPLPLEDILKIGTAAGQLGIQKENVVGFTKVMAQLGATTDNLSAEEASMSLAKFANVAQMSQNDFDRLGSVVLMLGNNAAATEKDVVNMGLRIAAAGKQVGMSAPEIMAFASTLTSVGIRAELGGTAMSRMILDVDMAVAAGSKKLGEYASVVGKSTEEFSKGFRENAAGALLEFFTSLGQMEKKSGDATITLDRLGLANQRVRQAALGLGNAHTLLAEQLAIANRAWDENIYLEQKASERFDTNAKRWQLFKNSVKDLAITIGGMFTPNLMDGVEGLTKFLNESKEIPRALNAITVALTALIATLTFGGIGKLFAMAEMGTLTGSLGTVIGSINGLAQAIKVGSWAQFINVLKGIGTSASASAASVGLLGKALLAAGAAYVAVQLKNIAVALYEIQKNAVKAHEGVNGLAEGNDRLFESWKKQNFGDITVDGIKLNVTPLSREEFNKAMGWDTYDPKKAPKWSWKDFLFGGSVRQPGNLSQEQWQTQESAYTDYLLGMAEATRNATRNMDSYNKVLEERRRTSQKLSPEDQKLMDSMIKAAYPASVLAEEMQHLYESGGDAKEILAAYGSQLVSAAEEQKKWNSDLNAGSAYTEEWVNKAKGFVGSSAEMTKETRNLRNEFMEAFAPMDTLANSFIKLTGLGVPLNDVIRVNRDQIISAYEAQMQMKGSTNELSKSVYEQAKALRDLAEEQEEVNRLRAEFFTASRPMNVLAEELNRLVQIGTPLNEVLAVNKERIQSASESQLKMVGSLNDVGSAWLRLANKIDKAEKELQDYLTAGDRFAEHVEQITSDNSWFEFKGNDFGTQQFLDEWDAAYEKATFGLIDFSEAFGDIMLYGFDSMSRNISEAIVEWDGFGEAVISSMKDMASGMLDCIIQGFFNPVRSAMKDFGNWLGNQFMNIFKVGTGGSGGVAGAIGQNGVMSALGTGLTGLISSPLAVGGLSLMGLMSDNAYANIAGGIGLGITGLAGISTLALGGGMGLMGTIMAGALTNPITAGIAGAALGGYALYDWASGPNSWEAGSEEVKRDFGGLKVDDKTYEQIMSSFGWTEERLWKNRAEANRSPKMLAYLYALAEQQGKTEDFLNSLIPNGKGTGSGTWNNVRTKEAFESGLETGDWAELNKLWYETSGAGSSLEAKLIKDYGQEFSAQIINALKMVEKAPEKENEQTADTYNRRTAAQESLYDQSFSSVSYTTRTVGNLSDTLNNLVSKFEPLITGIDSLIATIKEYWTGLPETLAVTGVTDTPMPSNEGINNALLSTESPVSSETPSGSTVLQIVFNMDNTVKSGSLKQTVQKEIIPMLIDLLDGRSTPLNQAIVKTYDMAKGYK